VSSSTKYTFNFSKFHIQLQACLVIYIVGSKRFTFKLSDEPAEACKAQLNPPFGTESSKFKYQVLIEFNKIPPPAIAELVN
jgi:hypothetical protein